MSLKPIRKSVTNKGIVTLSATIAMALAAHADTRSVRFTALVPEPETAGAPAQPPAQPIIEEMQFTDIKVSALLEILAKNFRVKVILNNDAKDVTLASITLNDMTPTAAVEYVAEAANLQFRKKPDGTYLIAKVLGEAPGTQPGEAAIAPATPRSISPTGGMNAAPQTAFSGLNQNDGGGAFTLPELSAPTTARRTSKLNIHVRNLPPSIIAYWLDPADNDEPIAFRKSRLLNEKYNKRHFAANALSPEDQSALSGNSSMGNVSPGNFSPVLINPYVQQRSSSEMLPRLSDAVDFQFGGNRGGGNNNNNRGGGNRGGAGGGGVFALPTGVSRIVAIDPQNALLVEFTDIAGLQELQDTIAFLDRPLRQVEIEAQFVTVSTGDSRSFGIDYTTSRGNFNVDTTGFAAAVTPGFSLGYVRGNFQAQLQAAVNTNRAKVITAPRVTAINNLTASLDSTTSTPLILTSSSSGIGGQVGQSQNLIFITTTIGLTVTPTINNDDTVTVLMQPQFSSQTPSGVSGAPSISEQTVETIANVRDGETIALGGLKTRNISRGSSSIPLLDKIPLIRGLFKTRNATDQDSELIIFLTARILRRFGDDDATPGT